MPIRKIRERIVPLASGKVLEIGVGSGVNFSLYDSSRVSKVYACHNSAFTTTLTSTMCFVQLADNKRHSRIDYYRLGGNLGEASDNLWIVRRYRNASHVHA